MDIAETEFSWERFKSENIAVFCKTEEASDNFLEAAVAAGLAKNPLNHFQEYKNGIAYAYNYNSYGYLGFSNIEKYLDKGYKVFAWEV